jgi:hypothetical protein
MPVILPSYGERASEVLIAQLTKNYKATVMLSDVSEFNWNNLYVFFPLLIKQRSIVEKFVFQHEPIEQSLESFFKLIELSIHTPEWLSQGHKSKRYVDNERPITSNELNFLNEMRHKEIVLMRGILSY